MARTSLRRFETLCTGLGATSEPETLYRNLIHAYTEPHRAYHTLAHLEDCLAEFDAAHHLAASPHEIEAALWFHDAVYDTHRSDNEERAGAWALQALSTIEVPSDRARHVADLVLATRHDAIPHDHDAALLVDVDLAILGQPPERFDRYEDQVRREYAWVAEDIFRGKRAAILKSLLARTRIYQTDFFFDRYEGVARKNLARSLDKLRGSAT